MTRWPWITLVLATVLLLSPLGLSFFQSAFFAGEQLTRNIAGPIYLTGIAILAALVFIEWAVWLWLARRRAARAGSTET